MRNELLMKLTKSFGYGILFGFVSYMFSGHAGISIGLGLFIIYLEYKFK